MSVRYGNGCGPLSLDRSSSRENSPEKKPTIMNGQKKHLVADCVSIFDAPASVFQKHVDPEDNRKRTIEKMDGGGDNPAKQARMQIENIEKKQEEMLQTLNRDSNSSEKELNGVSSPITTEFSEPAKDTGKCVRNLEICTENSENDHEHSKITNSINSDPPDSLKSLSESGLTFKSSLLKSSGLPSQVSVSNSFTLGDHAKDKIKGMLKAAVSRMVPDSSIESSSSSGDVKASDLVSKPSSISVVIQSSNCDVSVGKTTSSPIRPIIDKGNLFEKLSDLSVPVRDQSRDNGLPTHSSMSTKSTELEELGEPTKLEELGSAADAQTTAQSSTDSSESTSTSTNQTTSRQEAAKSENLINKNNVDDSEASQDATNSHAGACTLVGESPGNSCTLEEEKDEEMKLLGRESDDNTADDDGTVDDSLLDDPDGDKANSEETSQGNDSGNEVNKHIPDDKKQELELHVLSDKKLTEEPENVVETESRVPSDCSNESIPINMCENDEESGDMNSISVETDTHKESEENLKQISDPESEQSEPSVVKTNSGSMTNEQSHDTVGIIQSLVDTQKETVDSEVTVSKHDESEKTIKEDNQNDLTKIQVGDVEVFELKSPSLVNLDSETKVGDTDDSKSILPPVVNLDDETKVGDMEDSELKSHSLVNLVNESKVGDADDSKLKPPVVNLDDETKVGDIADSELKSPSPVSLDSETKVGNTDDSKSKLPPVVNLDDETKVGGMEDSELKSPSLVNLNEVKTVKTTDCSESTVNINMNTSEKTTSKLEQEDNILIIDDDDDDDDDDGNTEDISEQVSDVFKSGEDPVEKQLTCGSEKDSAELKEDESVADDSVDLLEVSPPKPDNSTKSDANNAHLFRKDIAVNNVEGDKTPEDTTKRKHSISSVEDDLLTKKPKIDNSALMLNNKADNHENLADIDPTVIDSDDGGVDSEEEMVRSTSKQENKVANSATTRGVPVNKDEAPSQSGAESDKMIPVSKQVLAQLIKKQMDQSQVHTSQARLIEDLQGRIEYLTDQLNRWKTSAKEFQTKIIEITSVGRPERRKSLKGQFRHVAIQVDETKVQASLGNHISPAKVPLRTPPRATAPHVPASPTGTRLPVPNAQGSTSNTVMIPVAGASATGNMTLLAPSSLPPASANLATGQYRYTVQVPANTAAQTPQAPQTKRTFVSTGQTVRDLLDNQRIITDTTADKQNVGQQPRTSATGPASAKGGVIDLTDDDDQSLNPPKGPAQTITHLPQGSIILQPPAPGAAQSVASGIRPGTFLLPVSSGSSIILQPLVNQAAPGSQATVMYTTSTPGVQPSLVSTTGQQMMTLTAPGQAQQLRPGNAPVLVQPPVPQPTPTRAPAPKTTPAPAAAPAPKPVVKHPAPLPLQPNTNKLSPDLKALPPKPSLKISRVPTGIVLSWNMSLDDSCADIATYQLFAYQEGSSPPNSSLWKRVGDVKALPLPMACTLTQFQEGNKYHFAVRGVDKHKRIGPFSDPSSIHLETSRSS